MTGCGDSKAEDAVDVSFYKDGPLALVDNDGDVRIYVYDEKLCTPVVDEERTRASIRNLSSTSSGSMNTKRWMPKDRMVG